ncbi:hypothetical protein SNE40_021936 [Patella caerulea]|uniref:Hexosyltransferase n=1 Tax=Patella caerulea TaxID=87958 RepID=A0AAN8IXC0_PATCE
MGCGKWSSLFPSSKILNYLKYTAAVFILLYVLLVQKLNFLLHEKKNNPIFNGDYVLNNDTICYDQEKITAVVIVHTSSDHFVQRQSIRNTYGSMALYLPVQIRIVFLLGRVSSKELQNEILSEHDKYGDIIQGNFIDAYHNLTYKAVMGLHWVSHYCPQAKYVVKLDDDLIFDMWRFIKMFDARDLYVSKTIYCYVRDRGIVPREGKWKVPDHLFKEYTYYPFAHCIGFTVIYSGDIIPHLYEASFKIPLFWLDDVYVTGLLRLAVGGIQLIQQTQPNNLEPSKNGMRCLEEKDEDCTYLAVGVAENNINSTWSAVKRRNHII